MCNDLSTKVLRRLFSALVATTLSTVRIGGGVSGRGGGSPSYVLFVADAYDHRPCTMSVRSQIQMSNCHIPPMNTNLKLSEASFLMSHDAATGYLPTINPNRIVDQAASTYAKNQVGTAYDQLNDGARALDLRPKILANGTVTFKHGAVDVPHHVTLETVLSDVVRWCGENDDELVLLLPSNVAYDSGSPAYGNNDGGKTYVSAMTSAYDRFGVNYMHCNDVYGLTVGQTMELARLPSGGYLLALDRQDYYGSFCGKSNWVYDMLVTCYSYPIIGKDGRVTGTTVTNVRCTDRKKNPDQPLLALKRYVLASANNDPTDDTSTLGPPANSYKYPFNEVQALWQVDGHAVAAGLAHLSSLLEDDRRSGLHAEIVRWIYDGEFNTGRGISLLAVDNVALYGNAILSVLRNTCGQSTASNACGERLPPPRLFFYISPLRKLGGVAFVAIAIALGTRLRHIWTRHGLKIQEDVEAAYDEGCYVLSTT